MTNDDEKNDKLKAFFDKIIAEAVERRQKEKLAAKKMDDMRKEVHDSTILDGTPFPVFFEMISDKMNDVFVASSDGIFGIEERGTTDGGLYASVGSRKQILQFYEMGENFFKLGLWYFLQTMLTVKINNKDSPSRELTEHDRDFLYSCFTSHVDELWQKVLGAVGDQIEKAEDDLRTRGTEN